VSGAREREEAKKVPNNAQKGPRAAQRERVVRNTKNPWVAKRGSLTKGPETTH
jgi:hypothetical protein